MTPADLIAARKALDLTAADLGRQLRLEGRDPGQTVRRWETGATAIPGPAQVAIELMLRLKDRKQSWQTGKEPAKPSASALEHAARLAVQRDREKRAADGMPPPPQGLVDLLNMGFKSPGKSRRRG